MTNSQTPREQGFHMPAEWAPQDATWLAWPSPDAGDFLGIYEDSVAAAYIAMLDALLEGQKVYLNNGSLAKASGRLEAIAPEKLQRLHLLDIPSSEWCRDFGPTFLLNNQQELGAIDWKFSKWGGKYEGELMNDADATLRMCAQANVPDERIFTSPGLTLEGGGIEVNGAGTAMTTGTSVLHANRNPDAGKEDIEQLLSDFLGADHVIWLDGTFENDDTDGHIDTLARFVSEDTIAVQTCEDSDDPNFAVAQENVRRLSTAKLADGRAVNVVRLPSMDRMELAGIRMPASYANFLIANTCVLIPQYGLRQDPDAVAAIGSLFPDRKPIPIDCSGIIWGRGALHCISQQVPRSSGLS
ncbi:MAG: agmatine deiminase family protein [Verrucomicrobiae bacterium]|nr:agmatine deiminase family protein [Verrucomicrobiae bacterium]